MAPQNEQQSERRDGPDRCGEFVSMRREDLHRIMEGTGAACWTIDRRVGVIGILGIVGSLVLHLCVVVWFFAQQDARLSALEQDAGRNDKVYQQVIEMKNDLRWIKEQMQRDNGD